MADHVGYNRQISTEIGWDNPFRPDGDLSREADEIVSLIKAGKPITPTPAALPELSVSCSKDEDSHDGAEKEQQALQTYNVATTPPKAASPVQSPPKAMNGAKNGGVLERGPVEVQRSLPQEPQQAEHVTIKKKPKCKCCVRPTYVPNGMGSTTANELQIPMNTEIGWDNPFRPDGDLSREADEIVSLIKAGKPITPTPAALPELSVSCSKDEDSHDGAEKEQQALQTYNVATTPPKAASPVQSPPKAMNGDKNGGVLERGPVEVQRSLPQEPQQAEPVTIKKKPKCKCCVLQ